VYGGSAAKVNINTAPREILAVLLTGVQAGAGKVDVAEIEGRRQEEPYDNVSELGLEQVADVKSTYFRVAAVGQVGVVRKRVVAVLQRGGEGSAGGQGGQGAAPKIVYLKVE
jgi:hypothetical protein